MELTELKELGLTQGQIKVYNAILELGISSLNAIQEKTGLERRGIYDIINKLIEKGMITYTIEKGKRTYQCAHPSRILDKIKNKEKKLDSLKQKVPKIADLFDLSKPDIRAEVFRGKEALKSLHEESLQYKEQYWIGGNSGVEYKVDTDMKNWFAHWNKRRAKKKVMMYDLVDFGTFLEGLKPNDIETHKKEYYKYCQLPEHFKSPMVILIFGDKVAQILWGRQPFAFVLESKEIKESFMKYFHYFWKDPW